MNSLTDTKPKEIFRYKIPNGVTIDGDVDIENNGFFISLEIGHMLFVYEN